MPPGARQRRRPESMTTTAVHPYVESLLTGTRELPTTPHAWLDQGRGAALERANALSVPTTRDEEWRFTDLSQLTRLQLKPAARPPVLSPTAIESCIVPEAGARLDSVDGTFVPELSVAESEAGARVLSLAAALKTE